MNAITAIEKQYRKPALPQVQPGDTVRVHQLIKEGNKQRIQVFEGVIIRRHRMSELTACITVRRIASGVGVEKTFLLHSPNVSKVEILRRAKVRRNFLSFLRERRGKSARLQELSFDKAAANDVSVAEVDEAQVDTETTEINAAESQDALDQAAPLDTETKAETKAAAGEDGIATTEDTTATDEQQAEADEAEAGVAKAEPGEGDAVQS
ncbi:MAG TPA: 50S ribosomal protein L19 [Candidatus Saccharimonadia bacterium]|nr:50S ribosomal protein L19 [Candidatus Saccharimonadia bacterium]